MTNQHIASFLLHSDLKFHVWRVHTPVSWANRFQYHEGAQFIIFILIFSKIITLWRKLGIKVDRCQTLMWLRNWSSFGMSMRSDLCTGVKSEQSALFLSNNKTLHKGTYPYEYMLMAVHSEIKVLEGIFDWLLWYSYVVCCIWHKISLHQLLIKKCFA